MQISGNLCPAVGGHMRAAQLHSRGPAVLVGDAGGEAEWQWHCNQPWIDALPQRGGLPQTRWVSHPHALDSKDSLSHAE